MTTLELPTLHRWADGERASKASRGLLEVEEENFNEDEI